MKVIVGTVVALSLHLLLGWEWSIGGGILVGAWSITRGVIAGGASVGLSWLLLVAYNYWVAPAEMSRMASTMIGFVGDLPALLIPVVTVGIGVALGTAGGLVGTALTQFARRRSPQSDAAVSSER